ncbi:SUKH-4 family immunity protein [Streptomyces justiciae]|uniref:SUKH-4 family immunity protein n=1 Tax=Streptomyces justiciae TaxID=2780140 RepID=A0ABU3LNJ0_9ACTN|nr:SUKH-4 family immunity protein [Streptomyces justiciae]MDT7840198.1 SUKH-4 family immunity protein [Streptomyces justiciae]
MTSVEDRLTALMTAPLESLVDPGHQVRPTAVRGWRLPEPDLFALAEYGLPDDVVMTPSFQSAAEPTLVPNLAGPRERELATPDDRFYDLGLWGSHDLTPRMGAVRGDGRVLAIRSAPLTAADLAPALREYHADLYHPAVDFISSSVAQFVDLSWRWRAAGPLFVELTEPPLGCPQAEFDAYLDRCDDCERIVLRGFERIDPAAVRADAPHTLWGELVADRGC